MNRKNDKITFEITGENYEKLKKFQKKHANCYIKNRRKTGEQMTYSFITNGTAVLFTTCRCVCGKSILLNGDCNMKRIEHAFQKDPEKASRREALARLQEITKDLPPMTDEEVEAAIYEGIARHCLIPEDEIQAYIKKNFKKKGASYKSQPE